MYVPCHGTCGNHDHLLLGPFYRRELCGARLVSLYVVDRNAMPIIASHERIIKDDLPSKLAFYPL